MQDSRKPVKKNELDVTSLIYTVKGKQVMLDSDLAVLYRVETKVLNQAVKWNINRFLEESRFKLSDEEFKTLRTQIVTSNLQEKHRRRRYNPYVFTEEGIAMLSVVHCLNIRI